jgi:hypothetical protein
MTLRLDDNDHTYLKLLCLLTKKSANQLIVDLLRAEYDRVFPGKRGATEGIDAADVTERLRVALGWNALPHMTDAERKAFEDKVRQAETEAGRIYGADDARSVA